MAKSFLIYCRIYNLIIKNLFSLGCWILPIICTNLKITKKETFWELPERSHIFIVKVQSVSRVLSWTVIFLRQSLPKGSSEYVEMPSRHLISVLAPSGVYMHALSPKRVWALTPHFHPYNLRCGIFLLHFP